MFTGIIEEVGTVADVTPLEGGRRLRIDCSFADALRVDESVAVDGVCLTVVAQDAAGFEATAVEETLSKTALGDCAAGDGVNLERALVLGSRLDGHLVAGLAGRHHRRGSDHRHDQQQYRRPHHHIGGSLPPSGPHVSPALDRQPEPPL